MSIDEIMKQREEYSNALTAAGFTPNGTNFVYHSDKQLIMKHQFRFGWIGNHQLYFRLRSCEIDFHTGPIFDAEHLNYLIRKWETHKEEIFAWYEEKYKDLHDTAYRMTHQSFQGELYGRKLGDTEEFGPIIYPILTNGASWCRWTLTDEHFKLMGFELASIEEKARFYIHKTKSISLTFTSVGAWITNIDTGSRLPIERDVTIRHETIRTLQLYNLI